MTDLSVNPEAILLEAGTFGASAEAIARAAKAYEYGARPTRTCFGLVQGGSDKLVQDYWDFYGDMAERLRIMQAALSAADVGLRESADTYKRAGQMPSLLL